MSILAKQRPIVMDRAMANESFMRRAIQLARIGMLRGDGGPFGAVVVRDGEIVGEGCNQVLSQYDPTAHGEVVAIRDACRLLGTHVLTGCELYTTGEPCPMCLGAAMWARVDAVYYGFGITDAAAIGFDDREFFRQLNLPHDERLLPVRELLRDEAVALAQEYLTLPGKTLY